MIDWQCAFILHRRPYGETSLLLDVFTEKSGRICLLAKGARSRRSNLKGCLQPFTPLHVRWAGRNNSMKVLCNAEAISLALPLSGSIIYSGFYLNELMVRVLEQEAAYPTLFSYYLNSLQALSAETGSPESILRFFELALLEQLGYGVNFLYCADSGELVLKEMNYRYCKETGFIASTVKDNMTFSGYELIALNNREFSNVAILKAAKRFTRTALSPYLGNKPLVSRELFR